MAKKNNKDEQTVPLSQEEVDAVFSKLKSAIGEIVLEEENKKYE